jgi:hypothetical protein
VRRILASGHFAGTTHCIEQLTINRPVLTAMHSRWQEAGG